MCPPQDDGVGKEDSIGSAGSLAQSRGVQEVWPEGDLSGNTHSPHSALSLLSLADSEEEDSSEYTSLTMFLAAMGLHDWAPKVDTMADMGSISSTNVVFRPNEPFIV